MPLQFQTAIDPTFSPVLYTPDYNFLKYVMGKKTQRYEQGLSAVSSSYNSLKKELSDPKNIERRDQYLKNAELQLQKIAGADLSLQENVNAANSIFEPMATDKAYVYDPYYTAKNKAELAEMESWRDSDDMAQRKKFNPLIYNWVARDLQSVREGNGNVENYKVKNRKAFAYADPQDIINQAVKDGGFTVSRDIDGGTYIYGVEGGVEFKRNYKTFADLVLGSNSVYQQQNQLLGEASYENLMDEAKASGKNEKQVLSEYANGTFTTMKSNRSKQVEEAKKDLDARNKEILAEKNNIDESTPEGQAQMQKLFQKRQLLDNDLKQYTLLKDGYESEFGKDGTASDAIKQQYVTNFLNNPKKFFSDQYRDTDINTFSNIRSQSEKTTIKPNTAYFSALTATNTAQKTQAGILNAIENTQIKEEAQELKEDIFDWKKAGQPITGGAGEFETVSVTNPDGSITTTKQPKKPQLTFVGQSAVDVSKTLSTLNAIKAQTDLNLAKSISTLATDGDGGAIGILNTMGVKRENVQTTREFFIKQQAQFLSDPSKPYKPDATETAALKDVYSSLFAFAKQNNDQETLQKLRDVYGKKVGDIDFHGLLDVAISQMKFKSDKDLGYARQWEEHKKANENIIELNNALTTGKKAVVAYLGQHQDEFKDVIVEGKDGKPQLIDSETIAKKLPKTGWYENIDWKIDPQIKLSDEDIKNISEGYINGTIKVTKKTGKPEALRVSVDPIGAILADEPGVYINYQGRDIYLPVGEGTNPLTIFPLETKDLQKKFEKINAQPLLPEMDASLKEKMISSPIYNVNGGMKDVITTALVNPMQFNTTMLKQNANYGYEPITDTEEQDAARKALTDPKNIADRGVFVHTKSAANNGGVAVAVTFADAKSKDEKENCKTCGQTYYFPINMVKGTPAVLQAFESINDQTEYDRIKNSGKTYDVYNYDKMGIKVQILPHTKGGMNGDVIITHQKQDPITKQYISGEYETVQTSYDLNNQTYNELKDYLYNKIVNPYLVTRINLEKQQSQNVTNTRKIGDQIKPLVIP